MSKNHAPFYDPKQRLIEEVRALEEDMRQLKYQQAPSVFKTGNALVTFDLDAVAGGRTDYHIINVILTPPNNEVLFAIPEFSLFRNDNTATDAGYFPQGSDWDTAANDQYHNITDFNFWYSWGMTNDRNIVARVCVRREDFDGLAQGEGDNNRDGTTPSQFTLDLFIRYRYLLPGVG